MKSKNEHFYRTEVEPGETPDFVNFWHLFMGILGTEKAKGNLTFPEEMDSLYLLRTIAACAYAVGAGGVKTTKEGVLLSALKEIASYGSDGICPYGCDTPNIATEALRQYGEGSAGSGEKTLRELISES